MRFFKHAVLGKPFWWLAGLIWVTPVFGVGTLSVHLGGDVPGHYLAWDGKPVLFIGDSITQGWQTLGTNFNQNAYIDALAARGINVLLMWAYEGADGPAQIAETGRVQYDAPEIWPWAGSTDAHTIDLLTFNPAYFERLKAMILRAQTNGIAVTITVHDGWTKDRFDSHPLNAAVGNGPLTNRSQYVELADYNNEMGTNFNAGWTRAQKNQFFQERFCDKLITELNGCSNVLYEMFNEGEWYNATQRRSHEQHFLAFFRARCSNLLMSETDGISGDNPHNDAKVDVVTLHGDSDLSGAPVWNQTAPDRTWTGGFPTFQFSFNKTSAKPYFQTEPVAGWNGTNLSLSTIRRSLWERVLSGAGWVNQNDPSFGWDTNAAITARSGLRDQAYDVAGHCARFFNGTNSDVEFWNMRPDSSLASSGMCLAKVGQEYVVYSAGGASAFTVNLAASNGWFSVSWYSPRDGTAMLSTNVLGGLGSQSFTKPDTNDWVLHLKAQAPVVPFNDALMGHWPLEEGVGSTTVDLSGNDNDGTFVSAPVWVSGKVGNGALAFEGTSAGVNVGHGTSLGLTSSATWMGWIYLSNSVTTARDIISKRGGAGARGWSFYVEQNSVRIQICDGANQNNNVVRTNATLLQAGQWYHVAGVYNATNQSLDVYVNGVLNNGNLILSGLAGVPSTQYDPNGNDVYLGRKTAASEWWNGKLDDLRIYARALTGTELATVVSEGVPKFLSPTIIAGHINLGWTGEAQLEMAPMVTGPWTTVSSTSNPPFITNIVPGENRFFRLKD